MSFGARTLGYASAGSGVALSNALYELLAIGPTAVELNSNGTLNATTVNTTLDFQYNWLGGGGASAYDVRVTILSGTYTAGTTGTWLNLATTRSWTRNATAGNASYVSGLFEIRNASTLVVLASATIDLSCDKT